MVVASQMQEPPCTILSPEGYKVKNYTDASPGIVRVVSAETTPWMLNSRTAERPGSTGSPAKLLLSAVGAHASHRALQESVWQAASFGFWVLDSRGNYRALRDASLQKSMGTATASRHACTSSEFEGHVVRRGSPLAIGDLRLLTEFSPFAVSSQACLAQPLHRSESSICLHDIILPALGKLGKTEPCRNLIVCCPSGSCGS